ncbi:MAG TPA: hypothetical protein VMW27_18180 [Thermoanaerobaculia bacterium]|nr:hypothetical protein [Thermoanaerobaculia bacterium]
MRVNNKWLCVTLALSLPLAMACGHEGAETEDAEDVTTGTAEAELPGVDQPSDVAPITAEAAIDDVKVGGALDAQGTIATAEGGDDFAPGQDVYVAMEVGDVPAGSTVQVRWFGEGENKVGEESKAVAEGTSFLNFKAPDTTSWAKGDYRVEVWYGDEKTAEEHFNITDANDAQN